MIASEYLESLADFVETKYGYDALEEWMDQLGIRWCCHCDGYQKIKSCDTTDTAEEPGYTTLYCEVCGMEVE